MKLVMQIAALLGCAIFNAALAEDVKTTADGDEVSTKQERYLGVVTEPVSEAMAVQLKDVLPAGQGLLVKRVLPRSPAAKAGLEPFDVLSSLDAKPLTAPDQFKKELHSQPTPRALKLEYIRGAKVHTIDVTPAERTVSRSVHRQAADANRDAADNLPAYSVTVQTRDGRRFYVKVRLDLESEDAATKRFYGSPTDIAARTKALPEPIQRSIQRQIARIAEDRRTLKTVQVRFQPHRDGDRQVLSVTLRKPEADGTVQSFELQQPMGDASRPMALDRVLQVPDFAAQLKDLDPAVRDKIASTLKTSTLPAATLKVEKSQ